MTPHFARIRAPRGWYVLTTLETELVWAWSPDCEETT